METKINIRDIVEFLTYKVESDICTDEEYGLYIDYRKSGNKVFRQDENKCLVRQLIRDREDYFEKG